MKANAGVAQVKIGVAAIGVEHDLKMQMLDALAKALQRGNDPLSVRYLLQQFIEFLDLHFLSEQMVMRLHHYPAYEAHMQEHTRLIKQARDIRQSMAGAETTLGLALVQHFHELLLDHISSEDEAFEAFVLKAAVEAS